ncbi:MAG: hypothetical protein LUC47_07555 [Clostridiales bacterium]|nr:hypothetical protein [Clostridiales bacterium]
MKKMKQSSSRIRKLFQGSLTLVMAVALLCCTSLTALAAADSPSLDWSMNGQSSITVELEDNDGNTITDGTLTLYQVALLEQDNGDMVYTFSEAFANCGLSLDDVSTESSSLASALSAYVTANSISGTSIKNTNGTVVFDGLELGLYLVVQTTQSDGYYTMNPFVVSVPYDENGAWAYAVNASPKVGVLTPEPEEETPTTTTTTKTTTITTTTTLPQTGQLNWPIPVLAICGLLLIGLGCLMVYSDRRKAAVR